MASGMPIIGSMGGPSSRRNLGPARRDTGLRAALASAALSALTGLWGGGGTASRQVTFEVHRAPDGEAAEAVAPATPPARAERTAPPDGPPPPACHPLPLPPPRLGRLTVVLDLDETLIAAFPEPAPPPPARTPAPSVVVTADLGDGAAGPVRAYVRPGLHAFLARLAEFADVVLFTAGLPGYAGPLCDALDPGGTLLPVRLFRPSTVAAGGHVCVKDLSALGRDLGRTVLVDNSPWSFLLQPSCGLPALPFYGDGDDDHLLRGVLPLLEALAAAPDVRPPLAARFAMASWLAGRGGYALYEAPCGNLAVAAGRSEAVAA